MKQAIIIFTRIPVPGKTKTRMMPYLSPEECAGLHTCFLKDIRIECERTGFDIFVYYAPEGEKDALVSILGKEKIYRKQQGSDLGARMLTAIREVLEEHYDTCILIGTDVPEIRSSDIQEAAGVLEKKEIVFGPTKDGGYYLTGMKKEYKEAFEGQTYGHGSVLDNTLAYLTDKGISTGFVRILQDMDEPEDIRDYLNRMRKTKELREKETGRFLMQSLKISIVIPIYNEEKIIQNIMNQLRPLKEECEIIFADGHSTDKTAQIVSSEFKVIQCAKGRAAQMNAGAAQCKGDVILFLHCDSIIPSGLTDEIRKVMMRYRAGCFGIGFYSKNFFMLTCRIISNQRAKRGRIMFGDQGIFIDRQLFMEMGGFPEIPIMEDYQFSLDLKKKGIPIGMAGRRIYTSDRRFPKGTIPKLKVMWVMNRLRKKYREGVPAEELVKYYEDIR